MTEQILLHEIQILFGPLSKIEQLGQVLTVSVHGLCHLSTKLSGVIVAFDKQLILQINTLNFIVTGLWSS